MGYGPLVTNEQLMAVMFGKTVVLAGWAAFQEAREANLHKRAWAALVERFQHEWDRRRAEQPLALADLRSERLGNGGPVEQ